jgi:hypothetical protein
MHERSRSDTSRPPVNLQLLSEGSRLGATAPVYRRPEAIAAVFC